MAVAFTVVPLECVPYDSPFSARLYLSLSFFFVLASSRRIPNRSLFALASIYPHTAHHQHHRCHQLKVGATCLPAHLGRPFWRVARRFSRGEPSFLPGSFPSAWLLRCRKPRQCMPLRTRGTSWATASTNPRSIATPGYASTCRATSPESRGRHTSKQARTHDKKPMVRDC